MHVIEMDQNDDRSPGKPRPPWRDAAEDLTVDADSESPELAAIDKSLATLASELRSLVFRDRQSRSRRDR